MITVAYGISHKVVDSIKASKFAIFIICKSVFWGDIWENDLFIEHAWRVVC